MACSQRCRKFYGGVTVTVRGLYTAERRTIESGSDEKKGSLCKGDWPGPGMTRGVQIVTGKKEKAGKMTHPRACHLPRRRLMRHRAQKSGVGRRFGFAGARPRQPYPNPPPQAAVARRERDSRDRLCAWLTVVRCAFAATLYFLSLLSPAFFPPFLACSLPAASTPVQPRNPGGLFRAVVYKYYPPYLRSFRDPSKPPMPP